MCDYLAVLQPGEQGRALWTVRVPTVVLASGVFHERGEWLWKDPACNCGDACRMAVANPWSLTEAFEGSVGEGLLVRRELAEPLSDRGILGPYASRDICACGLV